MGAPQQPPPPVKTGELAVLRAQARAIEARLQAVKERTAQLEAKPGDSRLVPKVDAEKCTACGICAQVCPVNAITINMVAIGDVNKCTGCDQCAAECPVEAISVP